MNVEVFTVMCVFFTILINSNKGITPRVIGNNRKPDDVIQLLHLCSWDH